MILYSSKGTRHFGRRPITPHERPCWEFYAVLNGRIAPTFAGVRPGPLRSNCLWVFPARVSHGWTGEKRRSARVAVFHYDTVPPELSSAVADRDFLCVPLDAEARALIQTSARALLPVFWSDNRLDTLLAQRVLLDLTLIVLRADPEAGTTLRAVATGNRVNAAEHWFRSHLSERPSLENVACRVGTSSSHLGKLFRRQRGCSPKAAFRKIQMERATELLRNADDKLEVVASGCGFAKATSFCTAFKRHTGLTPAEYRRQSRAFVPGPAAAASQQA